MLYKFPIEEANYIASILEIELLFQERLFASMKGSITI